MVNILLRNREAPKMIVSDNGIELTSNAVLAWSGDVGIEWHYIGPDSAPPCSSTAVSRPPGQSR